MIDKMYPDNRIGIIEKLDITIKEQIFGYELVCKNSETNDLRFNIKTAVVSWHLGTKPPTQHLKSRDLPYIISLRSIKNINEETRYYHCEHVMVYTQEEWFNDQIRIIKQARGLIPPHDDTTWNPFNDEIIAEVKSKIDNKQELLQEDIAEIEKIRWYLRDYVQF